MKKKGTFEVKTHLSQILDDVERGEEVVITRKGEPVALLIPYQKPQPNTRDVIDEFRTWRQNISWGKGMTIQEAKSKGRR